MGEHLKPWEKIEALFKELAEEQNQKLFKFGRNLIPSLTPEDMLQPNDYPELENNPHFRYEEGILAGILSAHAAFKALKKESS